MGEIIIQKLRFEDMDGVRCVDELTQRLYQGDRWNMLSEEGKERYMKSRKSEFNINCETGFSFVAVKDGDIIGFVFAHENLPFNDEIVIRHIAVHPDFQKQGIGQNLLAALITKAKIEGKEAIRSSINPDNPPSIKLHEQVGFEVVDWKRAILRL